MVGVDFTQLEKTVDCARLHRVTLAGVKGHRENRRTYILFYFLLAPHLTSEYIYTQSQMVTFPWYSKSWWYLRLQCLVVRENE